MKSRKRKHEVPAKSPHKKNVTDANKKMKIETGSTRTVYDNFKQGDLLFGLFEERRKVDKIIEKQGFHHTVANELNSSVVKMVAKGSAEKAEINKLDSEKRRHYTFLSKHRDYLIRQPGKPIATVSDPLVSPAYRRACKLLLINREPDRTSNAHFITNNIIWKRACTKSISQQGVTDSEVRAAYRDYLKNGLNPHIFFYDSQYRQMKQAPWLLDPFQHHWQKYNATRKLKGIANPDNTEAGTPESEASKTKPPTKK
jgi:hypothetical protein